MNEPFVTEAYESGFIVYRGKEPYFCFWRPTRDEAATVARETLKAYRKFKDE